ncbi:Gamma-glutamyltranspeptidase [Sulfitobacter noctilucicola]|uniref:Glutathione hydrolase proenzyme n=1 Tax=Sulfitobacter noctilucicola TaxID=1342301 RepID=A0A7W6Q5X7_9RHOB|nr:gamma-glutamyltransferase [Sulfitobacter noctilucicola]KIN70182.1 Gamma-glutamyltranspeptidase [Sulfitobacter noctilucicola]MBB4176183.1 gamma-glutamyltranspeptidase/glutathione hydrolase [Sulfitobacter noctilucicola]
MRDFHDPKRSPIYAANGALATSHPLATQAGLDVLKRGGNAVDAGVTAAAVLAVVEPAMTAIGGDGFALISKPGQALYGLNSSGRAAAALSTEMLMGQGWSEMDDASPHAVTVPGVVKCWESLLASHGTIGMEEALQPAIAAAEHGFVVYPRVWSDWTECVPKLTAQGAGGQHYLVGGTAPKMGSIHKLPALAATLKTIAAQGAKGFYEGAVAADIVAELRARGGVMTEEDLAGHSADPCTPVSAAYRGIDLAELPPNGTGITAQIILNMLELFDLSALDPHGVERFHLEIEASRIGYAIRDAHVGDPATMGADVQALIDKAWAKGLAATIDASKRNAELPSADPNFQSDTIYLSCVDRDGMAVSLINSVFKGFGSGIVTDKTGITLQNRGAGFRVLPGHPNTIEGGKRPLHTIIPAMAMQGDKPKYCFGVMGGQYQPTGHAHVITNMVDFGMDPQEALDSPRAFWRPDEVLEIEPTLGQDVLDGLAAKGHKVGFTKSPHGGGQIIEIDHENGVLIAGSDPRKDGCAMGY